MTVKIHETTEARPEFIHSSGNVKASFVVNRFSNILQSIGLTLQSHAARLQHS